MVDFEVFIPIKNVEVTENLNSALELSSCRTLPEHACTVWAPVVDADHGAVADHAGVGVAQAVDGDAASAFADHTGVGVAASRMLIPVPSANIAQALGVELKELVKKLLTDPPFAAINRMRG